MKLSMNEIETLRKMRDAYVASLRLHRLPDEKGTLIGDANRLVHKLIAADDTARRNEAAT